MMLTFPLSLCTDTRAITTEAGGFEGPSTNPVLNSNMELQPTELHDWSNAWLGLLLIQYCTSVKYSSCGNLSSTDGDHTCSPSKMQMEWWNRPTYYRTQPENWWLFWSYAERLFLRVGEIQLSSESIVKMTRLLFLSTNRGWIFVCLVVVRWTRLKGLTKASLTFSRWKAKLGWKERYCHPVRSLKYEWM